MRSILLHRKLLVLALLAAAAAACQATRTSADGDGPAPTDARRADGPAVADAPAGEASSAADAAADLDGAATELDAPGPDLPLVPVRCLSDPGPCSYAFSMGRLTENQPAATDELVQIGFYRLEPTATATACSYTGRKALKLYWHFSPGHRPAGTCTTDYVKPSRWDHAAPDVVDGCPTAASWAPQSAVLQNNCPPHITAGFGRSAAMITFTGNYEHDAAAGTVTFRWLDAAGHCKKEYWHVKRVVLDGATTELVSLELDGARTGDTTTAHKGTGNTHGFAYGSSQATTAYVPQSEVATRYASATVFSTADYAMYQNKITFGGGAQGKWVKCGGHPNVLFQYSCHAHDANTTPDLVACNTKDANGNDAAGAYLKYIADAFASNTRYNVWYSFHALLTQGTGCYHLGLHSYPLIQVMGSSGAFRGWVGIEYQEAPDTPANTTYHVMRRVEQGYE